MTDVVQTLWGFCHTLRHDGIDYADYIEQITFLLFLKMAEEKGLELPNGCDWDNLRQESGSALLQRYSDILRALAKTQGIVGDIYAEAQSRFNSAVNLKRLINLIDEVEWTSLGVDIKAAAYEGLLEKAASEGKKGAGQYFTPRILIDCIVRCMKPDPRVHNDYTIGDPACGTGGFLVGAWEWLLGATKGGALDRTVAKRVRTHTYYGQDLVARPRRLALMNLYLHGIEPTITLGDTIYEPPSAERFDVILTNPPFGTRGANEAPEREDFTVSTSNKQLNFLQHVLTVLKPGGRAALVLPDNCLFEDKAGEVFQILMEDCNVHTILRLPRGTFTPYSQGVKANVVFFQKGVPTENVWIFDARANVASITKKERPLTPEHFAEFERCYGADPNASNALREESTRFRRFTLDEIKARKYKLDIRWLRDEALDDDSAVEPQVIVGETVTELEAVVDAFRDVMARLESSDAMDAAANGDSASTWMVRRVDAVFKSFGGGTPSRNVESYWGGSIPWISSGDVKSDYITSATESITEEGLANSSARICRAGSVLVVVRSGILKHTLPVAILGCAAAINQDIKCFDSGDDELNTWLALALRASANEILAANREGTTVQSVKQETLAGFQLPIPPADERRSIIEHAAELLSTAKSLEARLDAVRRRVDGLPSSILRSELRRQSGTVSTPVEVQDDFLRALTKG